MNADSYPEAIDAGLVGTYPALAHAGGGLVWDDFLEYRVWCHPESGDDDYYHAFSTYAQARAFAENTSGAGEPLALIRQFEYIDEPTPGAYSHVKELRFAEWPVAFLTRPRRTSRTIPDFLSPIAPRNRLDILRGLVGPEGR